MRALKTLLIILAAVLGLAGVLGLLGPKQSVVFRSVTIQAPAATVRPWTGSDEKLREWVPWMKPEGRLQAKLPVDRLEVLPGGPDELPVMRGHFDDHVDIDASLELGVRDMGDSTEVTWRWSTDNDFFDRIRFMVNEVEPLVGPDLEKGLAQLKALAEKDHAEWLASEQAKVYRGFRIETEERPAMTVVGRRAVVKWEALDEFLAEAFEVSEEAVQEAGLSTAGHPLAFYHTWDTVARKTDVFAGWALAVDTVSHLTGNVVLRLPAGRMLVIEFAGAHDGSGEAYMAMEDMMRAKGLQPRHDPFEEYVRDFLNEPDTVKWLMRICWPVE